MLEESQSGAVIEETRTTAAGEAWSGQIMVLDPNLRPRESVLYATPILDHSCLDRNMSEMLGQYSICACDHRSGQLSRFQRECDNVNT